MYLFIYLVGGTPIPLKNMTSSVGMMKFPAEWKNNPNVPNHQAGFIYNDNHPGKLLSGSVQLIIQGMVAYLSSQLSNFGPTHPVIHKAYFKRTAKRTGNHIE